MFARNSLEAFSDRMLVYFSENALKTEGHAFAVVAVDTYRQVVETGPTHYIPDISASLPKRN